MAAWEGVFLLVGGGLGGIVFLLGMLGWTGVLGFATAADAAASRRQGRVLAAFGACVLLSAVAPRTPEPFGWLLAGMSVLGAAASLLLVAAVRRSPSHAEK